MNAPVTAATQPMQFGVPLNDSAIYFFVSLIAAIGLVYLFCRKKFQEPSIESSEDDYLSQLLPRYLATREEYSRGFLIYSGAMIFTAFVFSLLSPKDLAALGIPVAEALSNAAVPLAVAFCLVNIIPKVPRLLLIEKWIRQYAHDRAYIPAAARATAEKLSAADFDFSIYNNEDVLLSPEMQGVVPTDFSRSRRSIEHSWARLSCLVYELKSRRMAGVIESLDGDLLEYYAKDLERIEDDRKSLAAEVAQYRAERSINPAYGNDALHRTIRSTLYKLYILLGCAVRLKMKPYADINLVLRPFGFVLNSMTRTPEHQDLMLVGMAVMAGSVFSVELIAVGLAHLNLWPISDVFPRVWYQPFIDLAWAAIPNCTALLVANLMRAQAMSKGSWDSSDGSQAPSADYIRVAFACGIAGYVSSIIWELAYGGFTLAQLKGAVPYALLPAITGTFYVYHLDNVQFQKRPSRLREVGVQAAATGFCALIASAAAFELLIGDSGARIDAIILKTVIGITIGSSLAWYLPQAASQTKYDPLAETRKERIRTLEAIAINRFGDRAKATQWLEQPHAALDDMSPKAAAANVETFDHVISLAQGPRGLAA